MRSYLLQIELDSLKGLIDKVRLQLFNLEQRREVLQNELKKYKN